ncbi:MAG: transposase [bacterium]
MSKLLRHFQPGHSCFVTSVTNQRRPLLVRNARSLARAVRRARRKSSFEVVAWVVLPDHFHMIIDVPNGDTSAIMRRIKLSFSGQYRSEMGFVGPVWQHRYWDHIIRSQEDMNRHVDYIHYNPVKHGLAQAPREYRLSSFRRYCLRGQYDWAWRADENRFVEFEFGE